MNTIKQITLDDVRKRLEDQGKIKIRFRAAWDDGYYSVHERVEIPEDQRHTWIEVYRNSISRQKRRLEVYRGTYELKEVLFMATWSEVGEFIKNKAALVLKDNEKLAA